MPGKYLAKWEAQREAEANLYHLFLGTNADNVRDRVEKGRGADIRGVKNNNAVFTPGQVSEIRRRYKKNSFGPDNQVSMAKEFGVSQSHISAIVLRKSWGHI